MHFTMNISTAIFIFLVVYIITMLSLITTGIHNILTEQHTKSKSELRMCELNISKQDVKRRDIPAPVIQQPKQFGPGSFGEAVKFEQYLTDNDSFLMKEYYKIYDYNALISDLLPIPRLLPDYRPDACRKLKYPKDLPKVSIVIPFRNERLSVLLRTIHGVLFYTPEHLLEEIIIIDDASTEVELKYKLDLHVKNLPKVVLIRKAVNVGLMMARQAGIDASKSDYFICMDSHMEVSMGWVEPIINRLIENPRALLFSNIGSINNENFQVRHNMKIFGKPFYFPFFTWNFQQEYSMYKEAYKSSRDNLTDPVLTGNTMGMMICMKKSWFLQLGGFDPGMKVWGTEQIETSIKVWMCGGTVEMIPCSFVAHVYRRIVWDLRRVGPNNRVRLIETWVDEPYKQIIYNYNGIKPEAVEFGDVSERIKVREQNQCNSFKFFLDKVREFADIHIPTESKRIGVVINVQSGMCLDKKTEADFPLCDTCNGVGSHQLFELTKSDELRHLGQCIYLDTDINVKFKHCDHFTGFSEMKTWRYDESEQTFVHVETGKCLTAELDSKLVAAKECVSSKEQKWTWKPVNDQ